MKMKVYLSKSNYANPAVIQIIREKLKAAGEELIEYNGGQYDPSLILQANQVIIVSENCDFFVGKGQASEFINAKSKDIPCKVAILPHFESQYINNNSILVDLSFHDVDNIITIDPTNYRRHSRLSLIGKSKE